MDELQFLNEKDMEYFEELEEQGEAIILRLDPDQLIALDISTLFDRGSDKTAGDAADHASNDAVNHDADHETDHAMDLDSLKKWLTEHGAELKEKVKENKAVAQENQHIEAALNGESYEEAEPEQTAGMYAIPENQNTAKQTLVARLQEVRLDEEQSDIINEAILAGLDEKQLLAMLMDGMTAEKMRKMYDIFLSLRAEQ
ncbi:MAG: hypothetical protein LUI39_14795 [Lachnospiraceae bacterium]|nr:hypothetical protein [Lachnospiraceae bacterium]